MRFEAEIVVPSGQQLNVGRVAGLTEDGIDYGGNADQILLPRGYPADQWVRSIRDTQTGRVYTYDEFAAAFPNQVTY